MQTECHLFKKKYLKIVSFLLFLVCVYIYVEYILPLGYEIPCLIKYFTGYYCPGCGITRMFISIFCLDFYQAFRFNPLCFILFILLIIYLIVDIFTDKLDKKIKNIILIFIAIIVIIYGIIRNIPLFSFLEPTQL
jgi:hypothetical protein